MSQTTREIEEFTLTTSGQWVDQWDGDLKKLAGYVSFEGYSQGGYISSEDISQYQSQNREIEERALTAPCRCDKPVPGIVLEDKDGKIIETLCARCRGAIQPKEELGPITDFVEYLRRRRKKSYDQ